jgi:hypothetical protein
MRDSNLQSVVRDERIGITVHALKSRSKNRLGNGQCGNGGDRDKQSPCTYPPNLANCLRP